MINMNFGLIHRARVTAKIHSEFFSSETKAKTFQIHQTSLWFVGLFKQKIVFHWFLLGCEARYSNDDLRNIKKVDVVGIDMENLFPVFFVKFKCNVELIAICSFKIRCK